MTYPILSRNKLALLLPFALGCADLELIGPDVCGNHVVEAHAHEECDGAPGCGAPESAAACRFTCQGGAACPPGYGCGVDEICRKPSGAFDVLTQPLLDPTRDLLVSDADGDGRDDVLRIGSERTFLEFYGDRAELESTSVIGQAPMANPAPIIADLDANGLADIGLNVVGVNFLLNALAVYRLQPDRSFESTVYASLAIPGGSMRAAPAKVLPPSFDDEVLAFVDGILVGVDEAVNPEPLAHGTTHHADAIEGMVAARFDESAPCDSLAVTDGGSSSISIINPCVEELDPFGELQPTWRLDGMYPPDVSTVSLPAAVRDYTDIEELFGHKALRQVLFAVDWNDDGHLDLVAQPEDIGLTELFVAFGQGDGTFHSEPTPPTSTPDGAAGRIELSADYPALGSPCGGTAVGQEPTVGSGTSVLALADFDGDGSLDLARDDGVYLRGGPFGSATCGYGWLSLEVSDFDGNGTPDIAASRLYNTGIEYLGGAGDGSFARTTLPTQGQALQVTAGDYDGDLVSDLAFYEESGDPLETSLGVAFGRGLGGAPEPPVTVGRIPGIEHLVEARLLRGDSISDLAVLARDESGQALALVSGDSSRELSAPFLLNLETGPPNPPIAESIDVVTTGVFGPERGPLMILARDDFQNGGAGLSRPWLINASGDAQLAGELSSSFNNPQVGYECAGFLTGSFASCPAAAIDLNADGIDEVVTFTSTYEDYTVGLVNTLVLGGTGFDEPGPPLELDGIRVEAVDPQYTPNRPIVADLDGDGLRDLLTVGFDMVALDFRGVLVAFYNDGSGGLAAPLLVELSEPVESIAVIELDGDPQAEIVVGALSGLQFMQATSERTITTIDIEVSGSPPDPYYLAAGDVDGDGVEDLVVAGYFGYAVLRGVAVAP